MTYTIFRHAELGDLYCAVKQDEPVPSWICAPRWCFVSVSTPDKPRPNGFNEDVARFSTRFQGFYTFRERPHLDRWRERFDTAKGPAEVVSIAPGLEGHR